MNPHSVIKRTAKIREKERKNKFIKKKIIRELDKSIIEEIHKILIDTKQERIDSSISEKDLRRIKRNSIRNSLNIALENLQSNLSIIDMAYEYEDLTLLTKDIEFIKNNLNRYYRYEKFYQIRASKSYVGNNEAVLDIIKSSHKLLSKLISYLISISLDSVVEYELQKCSLIQSDAFINKIYKLNNVESIIKVYKDYQYESYENELKINIENSEIDIDLENPNEEFKAARKMMRHFIIHSGQTNAGKTYEAIQELKQCENGSYLSPLRLLAIEINDKLNDSGVLCNLLTGEEEIIVDGATHISSTIERVDLNVVQDICVIDECQMLSDIDRGGAWTRAILGIQARRIHLCTSPSAVSVLKKLIKVCDDTYEIIEHKRNTLLKIDEKEFKSLEDCEPGDALVVFSKKDVIQLATLLQRNGRNCSIIYGSLPYQTRIQQFKRFLNKETDILVTTDAVAMGVNLPIKRVLFMDNMKFDGRKKRYLKSEEVKQIAGRAGRQGMYDIGYVNTIKELEFIKTKLEKPYKDIECAKINIPEIITELDGDLEDNIRAWKKVKPQEGLEKCSVKRQLKLIKYVKELMTNYDFQIAKLHLFKLSNMQFDEGNKEIVGLWESYIISYFYNLEDEIIEPDKDCFDNTLSGLECYYKSLELYNIFCKTYYIKYNKEWINYEKLRISDEINKYLINNIRKADLI